MSKSINKAGLALVKEFEGCQLTAYRCPAGVWTIGYGHTGKVDGRPVAAGMRISQAQADKLLLDDLQRFATYVDNRSYVPIQVNDNQRSALISFAFNCGAGNLRTLCRNRTAAQIADKLLLYNKGGGRVLAGLTRRRKAERELFLRKRAGGDKNPYQKPDAILRIGCRGNVVKWVQWELVQEGYDIEVDGVFGEDTAAAVKKYQRAHGLAVDGIVGARTTAALSCV